MLNQVTEKDRLECRPHIATSLTFGVHCLATLGSQCGEIDDRPASLQSQSEGGLLARVGGEAVALSGRWRRLPRSEHRPASGAAAEQRAGAGAGAGAERSRRIAVSARAAKDRARLTQVDTESSAGLGIAGRFARC